MLKKLLVLSVLGVALAGCGEEKKVTADMLVGSWKCQEITHSIKNYNEDGQLISENEKPLESVTFIFKKEKEGIAQYSVLPNVSLEETRVIIPNQKDYSHVELSHKRDDSKSFDSTTEMIFISSDEFKITSDITIKNLNNVVINKLHAEKICKRVK